MPRIRIATFNVENLFSRFNYRAFADEYSERYLPSVVRYYSETGSEDLSTYEDFRSLLRATMVSQQDDKRQLTALALAEANADIVCLQEVDNIQALRRFRDFYLHNATRRKYPHAILYEGNDRRGIDVAALASRKFPLFARSHAFMNVGDLGSPDARKALGGRYPLTKLHCDKDKPRGKIFRRDCLELELRVTEEHTLSLFVCHFKSMSGRGRKKTIGTRQLEALAVKKIIEDKFEDTSKALWVILGDLNDYRQYVLVSGDQSEVKSPGEPRSGLDPLLDDGFANDLMTGRSKDDRWTHYYPDKRHKTQLDYILASRAVADCVTSGPEVVRSGLPFRVPNSGDLHRYPRIGWDRPKASDHCPVVVEIEVPVTEAPGGAIQDNPA